MEFCKNPDADTPLVIHVPHASTFIPLSMLTDFTAADLPGELLRMTDRYCGELFDFGDTMAVFPVSRLVCDAERFREDAREEMAAKGMGLAYTRCSDGSPLRTVTPALRQALLRDWYDPHHACLTHLTEEKLSRFGRCLILDGHSFRPSPLPCENDQAPDRPDFCIGTDPFHTPRELADTLLAALRGMGYQVRENAPFAGTMVPERYYRRDSCVLSVMIEVSRGLYMDERGQKTAGFETTRSVLQTLRVLALSCLSGS